ncbi:uncharacterized protein LOC116589794 [Mustela erminea]|uniref:uncharacterized protein LOC116589794 n=1 Tax=Mustela erminea TaxID=36723 RepID=UPI0013867C37|nr:uncharacterized protein LOC116589794 [Mustela erminea]
MEEGRKTSLGASVRCTGFGPGGGRAVAPGWDSHRAPESRVRRLTSARGEVEGKVAGPGQGELRRDRDGGDRQLEAGTCVGARSGSSGHPEWPVGEGLPSLPTTAPRFWKPLDCSLPGHACARSCSPRDARAPAQGRGQQGLWETPGEGPHLRGPAALRLQPGDRPELRPESRASTEASSTAGPEGLGAQPQPWEVVSFGCRRGRKRRPQEEATQLPPRFVCEAPAQPVFLESHLQQERHRLAEWGGPRCSKGVELGTSFPPSFDFRFSFPPSLPPSLPPSFLACSAMGVHGGVWNLACV